MSAVSFTGLATGLDTATIVEQLMAIKRQPIVRLERRRTTYQTQKKALDQLKSKLLDLQEAARKLDTASEFGSLKASSSHEDLLTVRTGEGGAPGSYDIAVQSLAVAQKEMSQGYDSRLDAVGSGTISFTVDGEVTELELVGYTSLEGLKNLINDNVAGVSASIIWDGSETGGHRLMLTGADAGTSGSFACDPSGLAGGVTPAFTTHQTAADASLLIDGLPVTATGNSITDAISGLTLDLRNADAGTTIHVDVALDTDGVYDNVKTFVDRYNDVMAYIRQQGNPEGDLRGNATLRTVLSSVESIFTTSHSGSGAISMFAQLGITRGDERQYELSKDKFLEVLSSSFGGARDFFIQRDGNTGKAFLMDEAIESLTDRIDGAFKTGQKALDTRIDSTDDSIERYERSLESYRVTLERKFLAMESMVAQLQAQGNYLSSMIF
ncbi:MAG: flagellar filament capping protein FliD [Candidatus Krumholzibacteriia bacterium]